MGGGSRSRMRRNPPLRRRFAAPPAGSPLQRRVSSRSGRQGRWASEMPAPFARQAVVAHPRVPEPRGSLPSSVGTSRHAPRRRSPARRSATRRTPVPSPRRSAEKPRLMRLKQGISCCEVRKPVPNKCPNMDHRSSPKLPAGRSASLQTNSGPMIDLVPLSLMAVVPRKEQMPRLDIDVNESFVEYNERFCQHAIEVRG